MMLLTMMLLTTMLLTTKHLLDSVVREFHAFDGVGHLVARIID